MTNFSCKKLTVDKHFDYSTCIAYDHKCNPLTMKKEMQNHFASLRSKANAEKYVNALLALWTDFSGVTGKFKKNIVGAAMFYADNWTFKQQLNIYHCLLLLTFPFYRDVMKGIVEQHTGLFVAKSIEDYINEKCSYSLSDATVKDQIAQVLATMLGLGVIKRYYHGTFIKRNMAVLDDVAVYAILQVTFALKAKGEVSDWLWQCCNFEIKRDFVDFFLDIDYEAIVGKQVWEQFNEGNCKSLCLNQGGWTCSDGEFVYDNGRRKSDLQSNSFVDIDDLRNAIGGDVFNGWSCR